MPTPNIRRIWDELETRHPNQLRWEFYNRRHIGSNPLRRWSQHAGSEPARGWYGNAADIYDPDVPLDSPLLDRIYLYLQAHRDRLHINGLLWTKRTGHSNHRNHIHVDTWPKMKDLPWYRPPPPNSRLITYDKDGNQHTTFDIGDGPLPFLPIRAGDGIHTPDKRSDVAAIQNLMNRAYASGLVSDGKYGPATIAAVQSRWPDDSNNGEKVGGNMYAELTWDVAVTAAKNQPTGGLTLPFTARLEEP